MFDSYFERSGLKPRAAPIGRLLSQQDVSGGRGSVHVGQHEVEAERHQGSVGGGHAPPAQTRQQQQKRSQEEEEERRDEGHVAAAAAAAAAGGHRRRRVSSSHHRRTPEGCSFLTRVQREESDLRRCTGPPQTGGPEKRALENLTGAASSGVSLTSVCAALEQEVFLSRGAGLWPPSHALTRPLSKLTGSASRLSGVEVAHGASAGKTLEWAWSGQPRQLCTGRR